ncbi:MAG: hypothetical protein EGR32_03400 [Solobacterium sp.]|nr:hypothetical protein [Solobacterium sp.]
MVQSKKKFGVISLTGTVGFFLAIAPVLDPYTLIEIGSGFTLKINDLIMLFLTTLCFSGSYKLEKNTDFLCKWLFGLGIIGLFGNLASGSDIVNSSKNLIVWLIYAICLNYIWKKPCRDEFFYWVELIAIFASILVIFQFICGYIGIHMWDGRIPGLSLGKYDGWAGYIDVNTGDIRPNGIFQEASYLGIYVSIAYAQAFKEEKLKRMLLYVIAMLMTTSVVAIITLATITVLTLIMKNKLSLSSRTTRKIFVLIGIFILILIIAGNLNTAIGDSITYVLKRFTNFNSDLNGARMSSTKYRIIGHVDLFNQYSFLQKLFGVGIAQYSQVFNVSAYSNVWVTTLLNCGIIGVGCLALCVFNLKKRVKKENIIYLVVLILVLSSDWQWFSWYFFVLISACILSSDRIDYSEIE